MELQALREQLDAERQMWEASCAKKEVGWRSFSAMPGAASAHPLSGPRGHQSGCGRFQVTTAEKVPGPSLPG